MKLGGRYNSGVWKELGVEERCTLHCALDGSSQRIHLKHKKLGSLAFRSWHLSWSTAAGWLASAGFFPRNHYVKVTGVSLSLWPSLFCVLDVTLALKQARKTKYLLFPNWKFILRSFINVVQTIITFRIENLEEFMCRCSWIDLTQGSEIRLSQYLQICYEVQIKDAVFRKAGQVWDMSRPLLTWQNGAGRDDSTRKKGQYGLMRIRMKYFSLLKDYRNC